MSVLLVAWLISVPASAQEDSQGNVEVQELNSHPELNLNEDKTLIMDADAKPTKASQTGRESSPTPQNNVKKQETQQKPSSSSVDKSEDPLSFNFLYFIIQKFKISDIVDD